MRTFLLMAQLDAERISGRIRQARKQAGLTQEQLAELLHVHKSTVENYEHGRINYRALNQVAGVLNTSVEWLLHGDPEEPQASPEQLRALAEMVAQLQGDVDAILRLLQAEHGAEPEAS